MRWFVLSGLLLLTVYAPPVSAELATPSGYLTPEDSAWRGKVLLHEHNATLTAERRAADPSPPAPMQYTDDGWPVPTIRQDFYYTPPLRYNAPIFVPSAAQVAQWERQRWQAQQIAALSRQQQVAAMYAPMPDPPEFAQSQSPPKPQIVVVEKTVVEQAPAPSAVTVNANKTAILRIEDLPPEVRKYIQDLSQTAQAHEINKLRTLLNDQREQAEKDKAFLLEEQRQRNTLILKMGGMILAGLFALQFVWRKALEETVRYSLRKTTL